jgi:large subunit ribosomal protein L13
MKTFVAKPNEIKRKWYIVDAEGKPLGRLASEIAKLLRGKHKPEFTPNVDTGDHVIVLNAEKIELTGKKLDQKIHRYHTGHPGGMKEIKYRHFIERTPEKVIEVAVKGMLPKNSLGRQMFRKLRVYKGGEHDQQAQKPEVLDLKI